MIRGALALALAVLFVIAPDGKRELVGGSVRAVAVAQAECDPDLELARTLDELGGDPSV